MSGTMGAGVPGSGAGLPKGILWFVALCLLFTAGMFWATREVRPVVKDRGTHVNLPDGVYYMVLTRQFWEGENRNVYRLDTQLDVLSGLFRRPVERSMPANVLPPAFLVLLPFALLRDMDLAYCSWIGASLAVLCCAVASLRRAGAHGPWGAVAWAGLACTLLSCAMGEAIVSAQTTIIHLACLIFLLARASDGWRGGAAMTGLTVGALFVLAMKPQYLAMGMGALLIERRHREAALGLLAFAIASLFLGGQMGHGWAQDYGQTLRLYQGQGVGEVYSGAFARGRMNIFAEAFSGVLGERGAAVGSWLLLAAGFGLAVAWGVLRRRDPVGGAPRVDAFRAHQAMISAYLLFSPHSGPYEEVMIACVAAATTAAPDCCGRARAVALLRCVGLALLVNRAALGWLPQNPMCWWLLKAAVLASFLPHARSPARPGKSP